jgi:hypothetical protein
MTAPRSPDTPFLGPGGDHLEANEQQRIPLGRDEVSELVSDALAAMTASGVDAERDYQRSLAALEHNPASADTIASVYRQLDEDRYLERWSAIQLITDMRGTGSVDFLADVLRQPIPEERGSDPAHGFSTVAEEVMIRTTAIEALSRRLAAGDRSAGDVLLSQLGSEILSIRRAAIQAATDSGDEALARRVRETVAGTDDEWMLSIRRSGVGSVPQPDPRRTLRVQPGADESIPPEPFN